MPRCPVPCALLRGRERESEGSETHTEREEREKKEGLLSRAGFSRHAHMPSISKVFCVKKAWKAGQEIMGTPPALYLMCARRESDE